MSYKEEIRQYVNRVISILYCIEIDIIDKCWTKPRKNADLSLCIYKIANELDRNPNELSKEICYIMNSLLEYNNARIV